jgi:D-alanyl-D-alanine carboxypeptidase
LQASLEAAVESRDTDFPGVMLYVRSPAFGPWTGAAGLGDLKTNTATRSDDRFCAGSAIKPFVAVVTLQLFEEGRFSLDDPLPGGLPGNITDRLAASDEITVCMLLNHTRGIADWLTDAAIAEIVANPARIREVDECVDLAAAEEPYFAPGKGWRYSNTD